MKIILVLFFLAIGALAFPPVGESTPPMESVIETDPGFINDAEEFEEELDSGSDVQYKLQTVTFAAGQKGRKFRKFMYRNICPLAAANMHTCIRCEGPGGLCIEFMKFSSKRQFVRYGKLKWVPKKAMATFIASGTITSGMTKSSKSAFAKALAVARKRGSKCSVVKPNSPPRLRRRKKSSKAHFVTTTITFGPHKWIKPWMYKNICPLAAKQMLECYRCKGPDGKCVEFQKFRSVASFKQYTKFKWCPKKLLTKFFKSGTTTTGYRPISEAAFNHKGGLKCERVQPGK